MRSKLSGYQGKLSGAQYRAIVRGEDPEGIAPSEHGRPAPPGGVPEGERWLGAQIGTWRVVGYKPDHLGTRFALVSEAGRAVELHDQALRRLAAKARANGDRVVVRSLPRGAESAL